MVIITFGVEQVVTYQNWKGKTGKRRILPLRLEKKELVIQEQPGSEEYTGRVLPHGPGEQWCLECLDLELLSQGNKDARRSFLLDNILQDHPSTH